MIKKAFFVHSNFTDGSKILWIQIMLFSLTWIFRGGESKRCKLQSTVRKKMATGTFTYNTLCMKTLKERIKTKKNCKSLKLDKSNAVNVEMTAIKPYLSICLVGLV